MAAQAPTKTLFNPKQVSELYTAVFGHSSLAKLSNQQALPFVGTQEFVFTFDKEVDIVAENGAKGVGGVKLDPVVMVPIKFEYGARLPEEFLFASEEEQVNMTASFREGFAKKLAKGLDLAAMHGVNPRTGSASTVVGTNNFDAKVTATVTQTGAVDVAIDAAIATVEGAEREVNGIALSTGARAELSGMTTATGDRKYPEFAFGGKPNTLGAQVLDINSTVSAGSVDVAIVGDFQNAFKWGISKEIPLEIIQYGDPDNTGSDLKGHNQIYLRAEAYVGWAVLDGASFARVIPQ